MAIPYPAQRAIVDSVSFDQLVLPGHQLQFMNYTVEGGLQLAAGTVLGRVTATGKMKKCVNGAGDGSEVPCAINMEPVFTVDVDGTTARDTPMALAVAGYFNPTALFIDPSFASASDKEALFELMRRNGLYTRTPGFSG